VFYGGAEFSRDLDLVLLPDEETLSRLQVALDELEAIRIAVPPFERIHLDAGMAVHFRCRNPDTAGVRIDIMSRLRGVDDFQNLWDRRTTLETGNDTVEILSLPDLIRAKKTQREKDWPMIARLVEANYRMNRQEPTPARIAFWLREARTPELLFELCGRFPKEASRIAVERPAILPAIAGDESEVYQRLNSEVQAEKEADRRYWKPLLASLEQMRHRRGLGGSRV